MIPGFIGGKAKKRKVVYLEKYNKGVVIDPIGRKKLQAQINYADRVLPIEIGKYDDGKEYMIIKIDGI